MTTWEHFLQLTKDYGEIILALVAITISIVTFKITRKKNKLLEYEILSDYDIVDVNDKFRDKIQITYRESEEKEYNVEHLRLLVLKFKNTGNTPIPKSDFEMPIRIEFPSQEKNKFILYSWNVVNTIPNDLNIGLDLSINLEDATLLHESVVIAPCLLNPNDVFSISFLLGTQNPIFEVKGRIIGVDKIQKSEKVERTFWDSILGKILASFIFTGVLLGGMAILAMASIFLAEKLNINSRLLFLISMIGFLYYMIRQEKKGNFKFKSRRLSLKNRNSFNE